MCAAGLRCTLPQEVATDEVREASQSHVSDSPLSGECRSTNGPADEEHHQRHEAAAILPLTNACGTPSAA